MTKGKRATTIEELEALFESSWPSDDENKPPTYHPRPTDVIITPHAKSGTTWLQQIAHGLRTRGSMNFGEITEVVPWIGVVHHFGWNINAEQVAEPRLFKSHATWERLPRGARYVVAYRHPYDVFVSQYRFEEGWFFEPNTISLAEYCHWYLSEAKGNQPYYFTHLLSWWAQRDNENVLLLCYEDMKADLSGVIRQMAHFMRIELDAELFEIVHRQSSREFMLTHKSHFDDRHVRRLTEEGAGLPPGDSHKVTQGDVDDGRYLLPDETKKVLDELWQKHIGAELGFANYESLRQASQNNREQFSSR
ncbi:MAG: sulfotransferase domain-containing protein [Chloroflexota bacterium]